MQDGCDAAKIIISVSAEKKAVFTLTKIRIAYRYLFGAVRIPKKKMRKKDYLLPKAGTKMRRKPL